MHDLVNGLRIDLTEYRRGSDQGHFQFMQKLYDPDWKLEKCLAEAKKKYPRIEGMDPHYTLVISHRERVKLNAQMNAKLASGRHDTSKMVPDPYKKGSMANLPQTMQIWPGLKLQACVQEKEENITNGMEYEVLSINDVDKTVKLRQLHPSGDAEKHGASFVLPHDKAALKMRLQHALCYYTAQGRTLRDGLVLCKDTKHPAFSKRHLITGIGRVGESSLMQVL